MGIRLLLSESGLNSDNQLAYAPERGNGVLFLEPITLPPVFKPLDLAVIVHYTPKYRIDLVIEANNGVNSVASNDPNALSVSRRRSLALAIETPLI